MSSSSAQAPVPPRVGPSPVGKVRWGLGDFFIVVGCVFAAATVAAVSLTQDEEISIRAALGIVIPVQAATVIFVVWVIGRIKGHGHLVRDFGFVVHWRDWWWTLVGVAVSIGLGLLIVPLQRLIDDDSSAQQVVRDLENSHGALIVVLAVMSVGILAPVNEELLFRGLFLRSATRRWSPGWAIVATGIVFAMFHLFDFRASLNSVTAFFALAVFGAVLAWVSSRTGDLSRAILMHAGFNLIQVLAILAR